MNYQTILLEIEGGVATLTLNRPEKKNSFNPTMRDEIADALARLIEDDSVRALILTGAGGAFCAGGDIGTMLDGRISAETGLKRMTGVRAWLSNLVEFNRPVIAAIDGVAFGVGSSLAMAADMVIASSRARFCFAFMRVGLVPDSGAMYTLPRVVGLQRAKELLFTAREIDAATAKEYGMVIEVTSPEALLGRAREMAAAFANASPAALALTKAGLNRAFESDLSTALLHEAVSQGVAFSSDYHDETVRRFMEKKPPLFKWPAAKPE